MVRGGRADQDNQQASKVVVVGNVGYQVRKTCSASRGSASLPSFSGSFVPNSRHALCPRILLGAKPQAEAWGREALPLD